ncbi:MAG: hypothetical protein IPG52_00670 [Rhodocyclaceae bacterium]|nr:hypothetical protein [Rhodocyclaceae bacterium]
MATSYAAGRWAQINDPGLADFRPYIKYHHADGVLHPRPWHVAWNGLVLPKDHLFWQTNAPPNGWGCHCYVSAAGPKDTALIYVFDAPEGSARWPCGSTTRRRCALMASGTSSPRTSCAQVECWPPTMS